MCRYSNRLEGCGCCGASDISTLDSANQLGNGLQLQAGSASQALRGAASMSVSVRQKKSKPSELKSPLSFRPAATAVAQQANVRSLERDVPTFDEVKAKIRATTLYYCRIESL